MSDRWKIITAFCIVSTVWGSTWLAIKIGLETVPPFQAAGWRFVAAAVVLYALIRWRKETVPLTRSAWKVYLAMGSLTFSVPFALVYWGVQFVPTGLSSILFGSFPFCVALFSALMLPEERLDLYKILALVAGFAGVYVIFSDDLNAGHPQAILGMGAILTSVLLQALGLILVKKHGEHISPISMNFVGMIMGAIVLLGLSRVAEADRTVLWTPAALGSLAYLALIGSVVTFVAYYWLLKRMDAVYLSLTSFINPIVAVLLGWLFLGERLSGAVGVGATLVMLGILVANGKGLYAKIRDR
jgi:drug/metabolite transporter (DMT)-like permease